MSETARRYLGQQVGHYRLTNWLGQGGFADVYLGEHIYLKTQNAIKMLHVQLSEKARQDFLREAQVIAGLDHPNIVRVFDYGIEEGVPYLVMNYAPAGSIRRLFPKGTRVRPERMLPLVQQIASALDYAHMRKLIHRDVKPENMLVKQHERVLLSDFGLVIVAQSNDSQTVQKMAGTVPYTAPEQLQGRARFASDQYALGIVTYEWVCGERPFTGSFVDIASQHMLTPPPSLSQRVAGLSPLVEQVVFRALAKDPDQRYETVTDFANALQDAYQQVANFSLFTSVSTESLVPEEPLTTPLTPLTPPISFHVLPQSALQADPASSLAQPVQISADTQTTAPPHTQAAAPPVSSTHPLLASAITQPQAPSPQAPPRQSRSRASVLWRAVVLVILIALIVGGGIWYSAAYLPGRGSAQGPATSTSAVPGTGQSPATSTAQVHSQRTAGTASTTQAGTTPGNTPASASSTPASGTGTPAPAASTPTQAPRRTPTPAPDCLRGSSSHLTFTSLLGLNPSPRIVTLTNCGGSTQNWTASAATNGGGAWLSANPSGGSMAANGNENIQVQATSTGLQIGIYTGSLTFRKGSATWTVTVTYTIVQA